MRALVVAVVLCLSLLVPGATAQAAETPPFVEGPNKVFCHASSTSLQVWMSTLEDDGATPYYLYGASTSSTGVAIRPTVNEAFTAVIGLNPVLDQRLVLDGTITVQAYIGGGTYTVGTGSIGTSLRVDGQVVASAPAKSHTMTPPASSTTPYNAISWTMTVSQLTIEPGSTLEWVISGTTTGNNVYLACNAARGKSHIALPVVAVTSRPVAEFIVDPFDTDGDGLNDTWENQYFGNLTHNGTADPDGDGLNNTMEQNLTTDPANPDTDGDGLLDGEDDDPLVARVVDPQGGPTGNATGNETPDDVAARAKDTPGLSVWVPVAALAAVAWRRRLT